MAKPTKEAIAAMTEAIMVDLATIKAHGPDEEAMAGVETFVEIALGVFAQTNPSKLREVMRRVEIQARLDGKVVYE